MQAPKITTFPIEWVAEDYEKGSKTKRRPFISKKLLIASIANFNKDVTMKNGNIFPK
ncbi:hypothetical protein OA955_01300 [Candidatus Marinimicrobia bacterium]|nr:hypothetical protein [Candidatus Neomarinimicrobiota bacterium]